MKKLWTKEKCVEDAKKYSGVCEWKKNSGSGGYTIVCRNG